MERKRDKQKQFFVAQNCEAIELSEVRAGERKLSYPSDDTDMALRPRLSTPSLFHDATSCEVNALPAMEFCLMCSPQTIQPNDQ